MIRRLLLLAILPGIGLPALFSYSASRKDRLERAFHEGLEAHRRGDAEGLANAVKALSGEDGFTSHARLLRAAELADRGQYTAAFYELSSLRPGGELRTPTLLLTGKCLYRLGRVAEAEQVFRVLLAEQPDLPEVHRWLATIYHDIGAMDAALGALREVARLQPSDFFAYRLMGLIYREDRLEDKKAIEFYSQALDRDPPPEHRRAIVRELSDSLIRQRDYTTAYSHLEGEDEDAIALTLKAECCWNLGRHAEARDFISRARALNPDLRGLLLLQASIATDSGQAQDAIAPLQRALEVDPHDFEARYRLALVQQRLGDADAFQSEMAQMQESKRLRDELAVLYPQAMERPDDVAVREKIAEVCRKLGKHDLAATWMRAAEVSRRAGMLH